MAKELKFKQDARTALKKGINTLADAVSCTLGPKGLQVIIVDPDRPNKIITTKDGVTVAKSIDLRDSFENAGATLIKEAALKTVSTVGDATTTATLLAQVLINKADEELANGITAIELRKQINAEIPKILNWIDEKTIPINEDDFTKIATISANNDPELGELIGSAYKAIGKNGVVSVESSSSSKTRIDLTLGLQFDQGYMANHFVTDHEKDLCVLENPAIFITEHKIENASKIKNIIIECSKRKTPLLIIAQDFDDSFLEVMKLNNLNGSIKCCLVKAPLYGEYRKGVLEDIAVSTNATLLSYDSGLELEDATFDFLGSCEKATISKNSTTLINGIGTKEEINSQVLAIKNQIDSILKNDPGMETSFTVEQLRLRIAKLSGGIARIYVGGTTDLEMLERKDRIDDAVCAVRAAIKSGIVRGSGVTYRDIAFKLISEFDDEPNAGQFVLYNALIAPTEKLLASAEIEDLPQFLENSGYDINTGIFYKDVLDAGIIDPALACKEAFMNAISVVIMYLSTACIVSPDGFMTNPAMYGGF